MLLKCYKGNGENAGARVYDSDRLENMFGKGENVGYLLFPQ